MLRYDSSESQAKADIILLGKIMLTSQTNGGIVDDVVTDESTHFVVSMGRPRDGRITLSDGIPSLITRSKKAMMLAVCRIEFANGLQWIPDPTMNLPIPTTQEDIRQEANGQTPRPPIA